MPAAIETLIPHRPPMRFIDTLVSCTEDTAIATTNFRDKQFAVADGMILESALVECVAQTCAAGLCHWSQADRNSKSSVHGMLVAVSDFKIHFRPPADSLLRIEVCRRKQLGPMILVTGTIFCGDKICASGGLSLYA